MEQIEKEWNDYYFEYFKIMKFDCYYKLTQEGLYGAKNLSSYLINDDIYTHLIYYYSYNNNTIYNTDININSWKKMFRYNKYWKILYITRDNLNKSTCSMDLFKNTVEIIRQQRFEFISKKWREFFMKPGSIAEELMKKIWHPDNLEKIKNYVR
jgi:hypothetical protein